MLRLFGVLVFVGIVAAAVIFWPFKSDNATGTEAKAGTPTPSATTPSSTQLYFNSISKAIKDGDLQKQATYVALGPDGKFRADFVRRGVLMLPKGSTVTFLADTLVTDSPNTGGVKAIVVKNGVKSTVTVLILKEKDSTGRMVWHITDVEKASS